MQQTEKKNCKECGKFFEKKIDCSIYNWKHQKYCSRSCAAKAMSENNKGVCSNTGRTHIKKGQRLSIKTEFKKGNVPWQKGKPNPNFQGENNPKWKGGITPEHKKVRWSQKYKDFREEIFKRDNYTCNDCGRKRKPGDRVILNAHHKKSFSDYKELRFEESNVVTLCKECHKLKHKKVNL